MASARNPSMSELIQQIMTSKDETNSSQHEFEDGEWSPDTNELHAALSEDVIHSVHGLVVSIAKAARGKTLHFATEPFVFQGGDCKLSSPSWHISLCSNFDAPENAIWAWDPSSDPKLDPRGLIGQVTFNEHVVDATMDRKDRTIRHSDLLQKAIGAIKCMFHANRSNDAMGENNTPCPITYTQALDTIALLFLNRMSLTLGIDAWSKSEVTALLEQNKGHCVNVLVSDLLAAVYQQIQNHNDSLRKGESILFKLMDLIEKSPFDDYQKDLKALSQYTCFREESLSAIKRAMNSSPNNECRKKLLLDWLGEQINEVQCAENLPMFITVYRSCTIIISWLNEFVLQLHTLQLLGTITEMYTEIALHATAMDWQHTGFQSVVELNSRYTYGKFTVAQMLEKSRGIDVDVDFTYLTMFTVDLLTGPLYTYFSSDMHFTEFMYTAIEFIADLCFEWSNVTTELISCGLCHEKASTTAPCDMNIDWFLSFLNANQGTNHKAAYAELKKELDLLLNMMMSKQGHPMRMHKYYIADVSNSRSIMNMCLLPTEEIHEILSQPLYEKETLEMNGAPPSDRLQAPSTTNINSNPGKDKKSTSPWNASFSPELKGDIRHFDTQELKKQVESIETIDSNGRAVKLFVPWRKEAHPRSSCEYEFKGLATPYAWNLLSGNEPNFRLAVRDWSSLIACVVLYTGLNRTKQLEFLMATMKRTRNKRKIDPTILFKRAVSILALIVNDPVPKFKRSGKSQTYQYDVAKNAMKKTDCPLSSVKCDHYKSRKASTHLESFKTYLAKTPPAVIKSAAYTIQVFFRNRLLQQHRALATAAGSGGLPLASSVAKPPICHTQTEADKCEAITVEPPQKKMRFSIQR